MNWRDHVPLELEEPLFHLTLRPVRTNDLLQFDDFAFAALHVRYIQRGRELQLRYTLEALLEMRLNPESTSNG